jgi:hypothetical protein
MKITTTLSLFASLAAAAPAAVVVRDTDAGPQTQSNYGQKCWPILFVFARGTTEPGNMVNH